MSYVEALHYQQIYIVEMNRRNQVFSFAQQPMIHLIRSGAEDDEQRV